jgi:hypothetical protein
MDPTDKQTIDSTNNPTSGVHDLAQDSVADLMTVTVADAANLLGLSTEAVRMRVKRGTLSSTKIAGTVYVLLEQPIEGPNDKSNARPNTRTNERPNPRPNVEPPRLGTNLREHNADLREQIDHLRRELDTRNDELRRKDTIIMAMTQRIPELEASPEAREAHEAASDAPGRGTPQKDNVTQEKPSWWRRFFGFV